MSAPNLLHSMSSWKLHIPSGYMIPHTMVWWVNNGHVASYKWAHGGYMCNFFFNSIQPRLTPAMQEELTDLEEWPLSHACPNQSTQDHVSPVWSLTPTLCCLPCRLSLAEVLPVCEHTLESLRYPSLIPTSERCSWVSNSPSWGKGLERLRIS